RPQVLDDLLWCEPRSGHRLVRLVGSHPAHRRDPSVAVSRGAPTGSPDARAERSFRPYSTRQVGWIGCVRRGSSLNRTIRCSAVREDPVIVAGCPSTVTAMPRFAGTP